MHNEVCIEGILLNDPVLNKNSKGQDVTDIYIGCQRDLNGLYTKKYDNFKGTAWGAVARALCNMKKKGDHLLISGSLRKESYENWKKETVYDTVINIRKIQYLPKYGDAKWADNFINSSSEIRKQYRAYVKEQKEKIRLEEENMANEFNSDPIAEE